jgi:hypothetical protein
VENGGVPRVGGERGHGSDARERRGVAEFVRKSAAGAGRRRGGQVRGAPPLGQLQCELPAVDGGVREGQEGTHAFLSGSSASPHDLSVSHDIMV